MVVFADFGESAAANRPPRGPAPVRVPLPADAPARREWTGLGPLLDALPSEQPAPASADLRRATGLLTRMTGYLEKAGS